MVVDKRSKNEASPKKFRIPTSPGEGLLHLVSLGLMIAVFPHAFAIRNARSELAFYGAYHQHPYNQLIHFIFVPTIVWTLGIIFSHLEFFPVSISLPLIPKHNINHATIWMATCIVCFLRIEPLGGTLYFPLMYWMYGSSISLYQQDQQKSTSDSWLGTGKLMRWATLLNILSWVMQVSVGHKHYEGGRPALLDSFAQSLTIAPLFAFEEGLWVLGINKKLQETTLVNVAALTKELCASGAPMRICEILHQPAV